MMALFTSLDMDTHVLAILFMAALLAGWVDAIAGGGGLIGMPALLWAGLSPIEALATNKLQGSFGALTATLNYTRKGLAQPRELLPAILFTFAGASLGAVSVQQIDAHILEKAVPVLLMLFAVYFLLSPSASDLDGKQRLSRPVFGMTAGFCIGFYDGFFGPGTGTFFTMAFVTLLGYGLPRATGNTKLLNLTSNLASLCMFILSGKVVWLAGLLMAAGQVVGSHLGSHLAIKHGSRLIRPVLVTISLLISAHLLLA